MDCERSPAPSMAPPGGADQDMDQLVLAMSTGLQLRSRARTSAARTPASTLRPAKASRVCCGDGPDNGAPSCDEQEAGDKENAHPQQQQQLPRLTPSRLDRIKELRDEMTCSVCLEVCTRPCTTTCGHTFCRSCLRKSLQHSTNCPKCRAPLPIDVPLKINTALWNTIQLLFPAMGQAAEPPTPDDQVAAPAAPPPTRRTLGAPRRPAGSLVHNVDSSGNGSNSGGALTNPFRPPWRDMAAAHRSYNTTAPSRPRSLIRASTPAGSAAPPAPAPAPSSRLQALLDELATTSTADGNNPTELDDVEPVTTQLPGNPFCRTVRPLSGATARGRATAAGLSAPSSQQQDASGDQCTSTWPQPASTGPPGDAPFLLGSAPVLLPDSGESSDEGGGGLVTLNEHVAAASRRRVQVSPLRPGPSGASQLHVASLRPEPAPARLWPGAPRPRGRAAAESPQWGFESGGGLSGAQLSRHPSLRAVAGGRAAAAAVWDAAHAAAVPERYQRPSWSSDTARDQRATGSLARRSWDDTARPGRRDQASRPTMALPRPTAHVNNSAFAPAALAPPPPPGPDRLATWLGVSACDDAAATNHRDQAAGRPAASQNPPASRKGVDQGGGGAWSLSSGPGREPGGGGCHGRERWWGEGVAPSAATELLTSATGACRDPGSAQRPIELLSSSSDEGSW